MQEEALSLAKALTVLSMYTAPSTGLPAGRRAQGGIFYVYWESMEKTCTQCSATFEITDDDLAFLNKVSPVFSGKKELIPPSSHCPQCRLRRRLAFRNQIYVFSRTSSLSGKQIFSMWPHDVAFPVYSNDEWWGDGWDAMAYARPFDFQQSFFSQFNALRVRVPHVARSVINNENSDYCNNASDLKNCYMVFNTTGGEDGMYCDMMNGARDCIDCTRVPNAELCYDCCACGDSYNIQSSDGARSCSDSFFLRDCLSCRHCFCCVNLCRKEYCIFNEQKTKEEYEAYINTLDLQSYKERIEWERKFLEFAITQPQPELKVLQSENVSGNYISNCKDTHKSYWMRNTETMKYCFGVNNAKDCRDYSIWGEQAELLYNCISCGNNVNHLLFCYEVLNSTSNMYYCQSCAGCNDCFGCIGLKKKQHCVFNTQYTQEEYEQLVPQIIAHMRTTGEWGEFFPITRETGPYNHSLAQRYFPLTSHEAEHLGLQWHEQEIAEAAQAIDSSVLPDHLPPTDDTIIARSSLSGRPFKITSQEIKKYRQFNVPLPRLTYDERMEERSRSMGELALYNRTCAKTGKPIQTSFPPDSPWIVWARDEWEKEYWS